MMQVLPGYKGISRVEVDGEFWEVWLILSKCVHWIPKDSLHPGRTRINILNQK